MELLVNVRVQLSHDDADLRERVRDSLGNCTIIGAINDLITLRRSNNDNNFAEEGMFTCTPGLDAIRQTKLICCSGTS